MKKCTLGERQPSLFELKALALDELHGDSFAEIANHVRECHSCLHRLRLLQITQRCNQAIELIDKLPNDVSAQMPLWQKVTDKLFELQEKIVITLEKGRELAVIWADGSSVLASPTKFQLLSHSEPTMLEKKIHIGKGDGFMVCSLRIFRDPKGLIKIGADLDKIEGQRVEHSRTRLLRGNELKESRNLSVNISVVFDAILEPGDYTFEIRGKDVTHRVELCVN